jgi:hypothetical protein
MILFYYLLIYLINVIIYFDPLAKISGFDLENRDRGSINKECGI